MLVGDTLFFLRSVLSTVTVSAFKQDAYFSIFVQVDFMNELMISKRGLSRPTIRQFVKNESCIVVSITAITTTLAFFFFYFYFEYLYI